MQKQETDDPNFELKNFQSAFQKRRRKGFYKSSDGQMTDKGDWRAY